MGRKLRISRKGYWRKSYHRKSYTRKDGTRVKATDVKRSWVPATTFMRKDIGKPGRGKKIIRIERAGALGRLGYATSKSAAVRHRALNKAVDRFGADDVWRMLHAQVIFRKRTQPKQRKIFEADREYVRKKYKPDIARSARKKWMKMSPKARAAAMPGGD